MVINIRLNLPLNLVSNTHFSPEYYVIFAKTKADLGCCDLQNDA